MKMCLRLNKFLCFKLETGAIVIGFVHLIFAAVGVGISIKKLIQILEKPCHSKDSNCKFDRNVFIGVHVVVDVTCLVWAFYSFKIIEATKRRKHELLRPITIILIIFVVLSFSMLILCAVIKRNELVYVGLRCLLFGCMNLYSVMVINSIYNNFKAEFDAYNSKVVNDSLLDKDIPSLEDVDLDVESALTFQRLDD